MNPLHEVAPPVVGTGRRKKNKKKSDDDSVDDDQPEDSLPPPVDHVKLRNLLKGPSLRSLSYRDFLKSLTDEQITKILGPLRTKRQKNCRLPRRSHWVSYS
ncbi:hypothetical protein ONS95_004093 [Cadophora gregata]|uniref:uncharacterized protein n=1 Tax=Cadophora gregata TaxID=51156 RepID=UPI0026DD86AE|nr:uncharacterized protein ONS95_004093 [Cadophora gregata]KAK0105549.1 hypothetical protein ONS96_004934 [Cadophora gregata f. sp. sojae]KAK0105560.1 hypothetical protein ONS95_004093 [Cadophora gregata]